MELLEIIEFDSAFDTLYILGDAIDRGEKPIECLMTIKSAHNMHFVRGNHEQMMLDFYSHKDWNWTMNGHLKTRIQFEALSRSERNEVFSFIEQSPFYFTVEVGEKKYFLSHAGLDASVPFNKQSPHAFIWGREEFYRRKALPDYFCIFGHTPTPYLHNDPSEFSVWYDHKNNDKICIDCGCVYGGVLAALRLNDGEIFYSNKVKKK